MEDLTKVIPAPGLPAANGGTSKAYELLRMDEGDFAKEFGLDTIVPEHASQPRDVDGKFIPKDTVLVDTTLSKPVEPAPAAEVEPAQPEANAEAAEQPTEQPKAKAPLTKFSVLDEAGQAVELPPVKLAFKDNGKEVSHDLEKVVSLAQMNSHNARQVQSLSETLAQANGRVGELEQIYNQYEQHIARMFQNPAVYQEARAAWLDANSPEKRAERAEAQVASMQSQRYEANEAGQVAQFVTGTMLPQISQLVEQFDGVTEDDLLGRIALVIPAYQVNGKVPPANLPKLQQFVETDLAEFAQSVHGRRAQAIAQAKAAADKSVQADKAQSQALKRVVGKVLAPQASSAPAPQAQNNPIKKASDVLRDPLFGGSTN